MTAQRENKIDFERLKIKVGDTEVTFGAVLLSDGSTKANKTGGWKSMRPITQHEKCISCGMCWSVCPEGCIFIRDEDDKFQSDYDYCKGCGICATVCPVKCITMVTEEK